MRAGPMTRGVDVDSRVADGSHSVILAQVTNGVAVRMAGLYLLAGGRAPAAPAAQPPGRGADPGRRRPPRQAGRRSDPTPAPAPTPPSPSPTRGMSPSGP